MRQSGYWDKAEKASDEQDPLTLIQMFVQHSHGLDYSSCATSVFLTSGSASPVSVLNVLPGNTGIKDPEAVVLLGGRCNLHWLMPRGYAMQMQPRLMVMC